jgi:K+-transporting ATPase KdpF subunit
MTALYIIAGLIALGLLVYLFVSLIKPEWFA